MSADNFIIVRKHPNGGFGHAMGFASADEDTDWQVHPNSESWPTLDEAEQAAGLEYTEYGWHTHEECLADRRRLADAEREVLRSADLWRRGTKGSKVDANGWPIETSAATEIVLAQAVDRLVAVRREVSGGA